MKMMILIFRVEKGNLISFTIILFQITYIPDQYILNLWIGSSHLESLAIKLRENVNLWS
jgi:hypothetical protein